MTFTVDTAIARAKLFNVSSWGEDSATTFPSTLGTPVDNLVDANVFSSELKDLPGMHQVIVDLDIEAVLVPSSTPGHSHLIIDHVLPYESYIRLMEALSVAGVVQQGYVDAAKSPSRQAAMLRLPWIHKEAVLNTL